MVSFHAFFAVKLESHLSHLKGFFPSWTDTTCVSKLCFCEKVTSQMLDLKGFFSTWTDSWCILKLDVCANLASQSLHSKGFFPSWTDFMCSFIWCFVEFTSHLNGVLNISLMSWIYMFSHVIIWKAVVILVSLLNELILHVYTCNFFL